MTILCDRCKKKSVSIQLRDAEGWLRISNHDNFADPELYLCRECAYEFQEFMRGRELKYSQSDHLSKEETND